MRRVLTLPLLLLAAPASAGLMGQSVTLNGVTATIGAGVEFSGTIASFSRPYTVDFIDDGLTIGLDNITGVPPGGVVTYQFGIPFAFTFASPVIAGVSYLGGEFTVPVAPVPLYSCEPLTGGYASCWNWAQFPTQSTLAVAANGIDLFLIGGIATTAVNTASFAIQTVPEPAAAALLGAGLLGLGLVRRHQRG